MDVTLAQKKKANKVVLSVYSSKGVQYRVIMSLTNTLEVKTTVMSNTMDSIKYKASRRCGDTFEFEPDKLIGDYGDLCKTEVDKLKEDFRTIGDLQETEEDNLTGDFRAIGDLQEIQVDKLTEDFRTSEVLHETNTDKWIEVCETGETAEFHETEEDESTGDFRANVTDRRIEDLREVENIAREIIALVEVALEDEVNSALEELQDLVKNLVYRKVKSDKLKDKKVKMQNNEVTNADLMKIMREMKLSNDEVRKEMKTDKKETKEDIKKLVNKVEEIGEEVREKDKEAK